jgi:hypothetical protein
MSDSGNVRRDNRPPALDSSSFVCAFFFMWSPAGLSSIGASLGVVVQPLLAEPLPEEPPTPSVAALDSTRLLSSWAADGPTVAAARAAHTAEPVCDDSAARRVAFLRLRLLATCATQPPAARRISRASLRRRSRTWKRAARATVADGLRAVGTELLVEGRRGIGAAEADIPRQVGGGFGGGMGGGTTWGSDCSSAQPSTRVVEMTDHELLLDALYIDPPLLNCGASTDSGGGGRETPPDELASSASLLRGFRAPAVSSGDDGRGACGGR